MGLLNSLMGNASEIDISEITEELRPILADGEQVAIAFKVIRDQFIFTNKRLMLVDKQGITGKKAEYLSIPYKSISKFSVETAGRFDMDAELKVWVGSALEPITKELKSGADIVGIQKTLANAILG